LIESKSKVPFQQAVAGNAVGEVDTVSMSKIPPQIQSTEFEEAGFNHLGVIHQMGMDQYLLIPFLVG